MNEKEEQQSERTLEDPIAACCRRADKMLRLGKVSLYVPFGIFVLGNLLDIAALTLAFYVYIGVWIMFYGTVRCMVILWQDGIARQPPYIHSLKGLLLCLMADAIYVWLVICSIP